MRKLFIFLLLFFIGCTGTNVSDDEVKRANQFYESIFLDQVQDSPEFQTRLGYKSNYTFTFYVLKITMNKHDFLL